jgi:Flp pilus assembly protein TadG
LRAPLNANEGVRQKMKMEHPKAQLPTTRRGERGADLVEFTLVLVIFFAILLAIVALGRALSGYHFVNDAARQATRYAIAEQSACAARAGECPVTSAEIQDYVRRIGSGQGIRAKNVRVATAWTPGRTVQVRVSYADPVFSEILPSATITLFSTSQMAISR